VVLLIFDGKEFKAYDDWYFVSADGDVFSTYKNGLLKQSVDVDGYMRVDIHSKHVKVHKLVYTVWIGDIPIGVQINHLDDDKKHNHYQNLYTGTQKENIADCMKNGHRVGNIQSVMVFDKKIGECIQFPSVKEFLAYTGHSIKNGSISHCKNKKWFQTRFEVIEQKGVSTIESYKSIRAVYDSRVENKADIPHEASRVERDLSPFEAQGPCSCKVRDGQSRMATSGTSIRAS